ncbi:glycosyltransferase family 39 protein [Patescibacteria group bacterium]|nr:glycosyltransferase family 39 protein [Patescibacteria group bacterium]
MDKKRVLFALLSILIIASFLRLYNLAPADKSGSFSPPGLYADEAMNGNNAQRTWDTKDFKIFYPENFGREGLFINIESLSVAAFGNQPWALRLPSALFGIATVLGIFFLALTLYDDPAVALMAAFFLATSFWHVDFSRIAFRAIMAPFFLVWGLMFFLRTLKRDGTRTQAILGGVVYGLGFYSYIAYRITPLLMIITGIGALLTLPRPERKNSLKRFWLFTGTAVLVALPIGVYFLQHPADFFGRTTGLSITTTAAPLQDLMMNTVKTLGMFNFIGDGNWRHNFAGRPELSFGVGIFFLIGIILSLWTLWKNRSASLTASPSDKLRANQKKNAAAALITGSWFILLLFPSTLSNEGIPHALRSILLLPPAMLFAALGAAATYRWLRAHGSKPIVDGAAIFFFILLVAETYTLYFVAWTNRPEVQAAFDYHDYMIGSQLATLPDQLKKYVVVPDTTGTIRQDYPISLQPILFMTGTYTDQQRTIKNITYLTPEQFASFQQPQGSIVIKL